MEADGRRLRLGNPRRRGLGDRVVLMEPAERPSPTTKVAAYCRRASDGNVEEMTLCVRRMCREHTASPAPRWDRSQDAPISLQAPVDSSKIERGAEGREGRAGSQKRRVGRRLRNERDILRTLISSHPQL